ncbi:MAG: hypothetical protein FWD97_03915, partial [Defluviitaleaceae bacterium]|nr:hypothetical protein [Defluviitaleaceae bacterium]
MKNFVKKKGVLASCLFGLALVACGGEQDTEYHTTYGDPHPEGYYEYVGGGVGDYIDLNARFLEDVDYLFYILENNFPLFNATERVVGIDTQQLMMNTRNYTETSEFATDSNRHIERVLRSNFFIHFNNGHHRNNFGLLEALTQEDFRRHLYNNPREEWLPIIDNPSTRSLFGLVISPFPTGESEWFVAKSIEEGYVAYIGWEQLTEAHTNHQTGNLFGVAMETHGDMILEFLQSIVDYEHLIIDLRTIERARFDYFPEMIIQNLISEPITYDHHFFSMGGEYVRQFYNILPRGQAGFVPVTDELLAGFPYLHPDDAGILRYHYHLERIIHPSANSIGFDGKIWVLI